MGRRLGGDHRADVVQWVVDSATVARHDRVRIEIPHDPADQPVERRSAHRGAMERAVTGEPEHVRAGEGMDGDEGLAVRRVGEGRPPVVDLDEAWPAELMDDDVAPEFDIDRETAFDQPVGLSLSLELAEIDDRDRRPRGGLPKRQRPGRLTRGVRRVRVCGIRRRRRSSRCRRWSATPSRSGRRRRSWPTA
jgi:hypothetical protein